MNAQIVQCRNQACKNAEVDLKKHRGKLEVLLPQRQKQAYKLKFSIQKCNLSKKHRGSCLGLPQRSYGGGLVICADVQGE